MWLLGWDGISILEGEKVSFDTYLGFIVWWVCMKVHLTWVDMVPFMGLYIWFMRNDMLCEDLLYGVVMVC